MKPSPFRAFASLSEPLHAAPMPARPSPAYRYGLYLISVITLIACGGPKEAARTLPGPSPSPVVSSPSVRPSAAPAVSLKPSPSVSAEGVTFNGATFQVPRGWALDARGAEGYLGHLAGGPQDVELYLYVGTNSLESFRPQICPREGDPATPALKVEVVAAGGFLLDEGRTIPYRQWRVTCPDGTTLHRAWALPNLVIYEQRATSETEGVVRSVILR